MAKKKHSGDSLSIIVPLMQMLVAIELWRAGLTQGGIAKRLSLSKTTVNEMLRGVSREIKSSVDKEK